MNWRGLSNEQQYRLLLALLLGAGLLVAGNNYVLGPFLKRRAAASEARDDMRERVEKAQQEIRREFSLDKQMHDTRAALGQVFADLMPPPDDALAWATQYIDRQSRTVGLDIISVAEVDVGASAWERGQTSRRTFHPYAVRVEFAGSFAQVRNLVRSLHESNPYMTITHLSIAADSRFVDKHASSIVLEWPAWKNPKQGQQPFGLPASAPREEKGGDKRV